YGESLGTGVVVDLGTRAIFKGIVLEAPYTSIEALAKKRYWFIPVSYLLKDKFDSINKVSQLTSPTLVLHGDSDRVINLDYGKQLYDATPQPKNFVMFPGGGHSNLFDFGAGTEIVTFINSLE
ncbi:MAG: alpha/beta hydrolase, partial [Rhodobacteraceae bacterium]|nr:alpha/beta hydrolase [Paracoccaceae bacterium]